MNNLRINVYITKKNEFSVELQIMYNLFTFIFFIFYFSNIKKLVQKLSPKYIREYFLNHFLTGE